MLGCGDFSFHSWAEAILSNTRTVLDVSCCLNNFELLIFSVYDTSVTSMLDDVLSFILSLKFVFCLA